MEKVGEYTYEIPKALSPLPGFVAKLCLVICQIFSYLIFLPFSYNYIINNK